MRTFLDGSGSDSTAAVIAHLAQRRQIFCADLVQIKTYFQGEQWSQNRLLAIYDRPLKWSHVGTFVPAKIKRGEIESKVGLETVTLELTWPIDDTELLLGFSPTDGSVPTLLQSFESGIWDNGRVYVYRTYMPTDGDADTFGACTLFAGRIAEASPERTGVSLKVNSLTELFDAQLPPNLIEPTNVQSEFSIGQPPAGLSSVPSFTVVAGSTPSTIVANCTGPNAGQIFADEVFDFGYLFFDTGGDCGLMFRTVRRSTNGFGHNKFLLYEPLPWTPKAGDTFLGYVPFARGTTQATTITASIPGSGPYTINVGATWASDVSVRFALGGTPSYTVAAGIYTFTAPDAGKQVIITFNGLVGSGYQGFPFVPPASQAT
jgi:hypothetical protein